MSVLLAPVDWMRMVPLFSTLAVCPEMMSLAPSSIVTLTFSGMFRVPSMVRTVPETSLRSPVTVTIWVDVNVVFPVLRVPEIVASSETAEVLTDPVPPIVGTSALSLRTETTPLLVIVSVPMSFP